MNRGILSTIYVRGKRGRTPNDLHAILLKYYMKEPFVHVLPFGETPQTRHVRGSNMTFIGVAKDRKEGRAIVVSALDNLVKGASGQAIQNMNLIMGWPETTGLDQIALFPVGVIPAPPNRAGPGIQLHSPSLVLDSGFAPFGAPRNDYGGERPMFEVQNQPPPLEGYNLLHSDTILREAVKREGAEWAEGRLGALGGEL